VRTGVLEKIMPAVRLVQSHPTRRLSLREAAATCGLSVSQFGYLFRRLMGLSFGKFCMRARLAYVAQLLLTTDLPVEAIADAARFSDASHLHHAFVGVYGTTPARYRREGQRVSTEHEYRQLEEVSVGDYAELPAHTPEKEGRRQRDDGSARKRAYAEIEVVGPDDYAEVDRS
jgi:AraC-like DNA-binding protein